MSERILLGNIKGPQGEQGPPGEDGADGNAIIPTFELDDNGDLYVVTDGGA